MASFEVVNPEPTEPCANCAGTGLVDGGYKYRKTCPVCHGTKVTTATA